MDYRKTAQDILDHVGGSKNIASAAHCATRLRLVIADNKKVSKEALENVDGVKGVFEASGQLQIIFGTGAVNKVYDEFIAIANIAGGTKEENKEESKEEKAVNKTKNLPESKEVLQESAKELYSPLKGEVIKLSEVPDEILGKGMAVIPKEGLVTAPVDGEVSTLFDTLHAIGITGDNGVEILIHVGINTVELEGKYYKALVKEGDKVTKGQPLLECDLVGIRKAGYNTVTPVIITNSNEYEEIELTAYGDVEKTNVIMKIRKGVRKIMRSLNITVGV